MPENREEVRYHMLRPDRILQRRRACPIAWIPLGTLEWHGRHNPVGADGLQAEALAEMCALQGGGLVFPTLYYGESRLSSLMDVNAEDAGAIQAAMDLSGEHFAPEKFPDGVAEQFDRYHKLLTHILAEVQSLGFAVGVFVCGHYPLADHAGSVCQQFNQWPGARYGGLLPWAFVDYMLVGDRYENPGDHAAGWETSHLLASHPETVDLSVLPGRDGPLVGVGGARPPQDATAQFGREIYQAVAEAAVREAHCRWKHPEWYRAPGRCMLLGLWRDQE